MKLKFIGILRGVENIFLSDCLQVLSLLNVGSKGISEPHQNSSKEKNQIIGSIGR